MIVRLFMVTAAILAGLSVALGAFSAHALKDRLSVQALTIFETGARYQMYHALGLLLVAVLLSRAGEPPTSLVVAGFAFIAGIALFSGSLYTLSFTGISWLGAIAPVGGVAFMIGWACLAVAGWNFQQ